MRGVTKYSSIWLNKSSDPLGKLPWRSDGSKYLSNAERVIVDHAVRAWMRHGAGHTCAAPPLARLPRGNYPVPRENSQAARRPAAQPGGRQAAQPGGRPLRSILGVGVSVGLVVLNVCRVVARQTRAAA